jgi:ABC-type phosphate/phosphonate transport system substrate-binding protein
MQSNESSTRIRNLVISLAIFAALALYASTYAEPVLRVSAMPGEPPPVMRRKLKPLLDYLEKKIGMKLEFRPMRDGDALVDALLAKKLDMVWIDGPDLIRASTRSNDQIVPLVQRAEDTQAQNNFTWTVRADMDADLRQKLTEAFLALDRKNGQDAEILDLQRVGKFVPAHAQNYNVIEAPARRAGQTQ